MCVMCGLKLKYSGESAQLACTASVFAVLNLDDAVVVVVGFGVTYIHCAACVWESSGTGA